MERTKTEREIFVDKNANVIAAREFCKKIIGGQKIADFQDDSDKMRQYRLALKERAEAEAEAGAEFDKRKDAENAKRFAALSDIQPDVFSVVVGYNADKHRSVFERYATMYKSYTKFISVYDFLKSAKDAIRAEIDFIKSIDGSNREIVKMSVDDERIICAIETVTMQDGTKIRFAYPIAESTMQSYQNLFTIDDIFNCDKIQKEKCRNVTFKSDDMLSIGEIKAIVKALGSK